MIFLHNHKYYKDNIAEILMIEKDIVVTRREVEAKIATIGDYVKMDYLSSCLKKQLDFDTKKFVLNKLALIYEQRGMFTEAAKMMKASADINTTFDGKLNDFVKSTELFVKGGNFDEAEVSYAKALGCANTMQKEIIKGKRKDFYRAQAKEYLKKDKRKHAMDAYEKILMLDLNPQEKQEVQAALLPLYEKLGKVTEFYNLKKIM